jgi:short-subunit dehydrogenase
MTITNHKNMNILITGATKGIGRAIAEKFAEKGAGLAVCARTEKDVVRLKGSLAKKTKAEVIAVPCDMADKKQVKAFAAQVKKRWDKLDVLVNNAGIFLPGKVTAKKEPGMEEIMAANFYSAYYITREVLPLMLPHRSGHIFNMCSVASIKAYPQGGLYAISKHALLGFSRTLREELKEQGIRVTTLLPGATYTPSWLSSGLPEQRFMDVKDLAQIVWDIYSLSERTVVEDILLRPMLGDI